VKIKSWYIPGDSDTYKILRELGIPLLKIHSDFIPTLEIQARPRGIRAKVSHFTNVRDALLDRLGLAWKKKPGRNCSLNDHRLIFTAKPSDESREAFAKVETIFHKFCVRWGHSFDSTFSEAPTKLKLVMDYKFDPNRNPLITVEDSVTKEDLELVLGFTKIKLTFQTKSGEVTRMRGCISPVTLLEIFTQAGSAWIPVHSATFADQNIGDPKQFLEAMGLLFNRRKLAIPD
jgi:hypothetical protein